MSTAAKSPDSSAFPVSHPFASHTHNNNNAHKSSCPECISQELQYLLKENKSQRGFSPAGLQCC